MRGEGNTLKCNPQHTVNLTNQGWKSAVTQTHWGMVRVKRKRIKTK